MAKPFDSSSSPASNPSTSSFGKAVTKVDSLKKEATKLKSEKRYDEAVEKLREANMLADEYGIEKDYMRLPMYLQLAGHGDEGWGELNMLVVEHRDVFSQAKIANQMRIFLEKERRYRRALDFAVWNICKVIDRDRYNISSDKQREQEYRKLIGDDNLSHDFEPSEEFYQEVNSRITYTASVEGITAAIQKIAKKLNKEEKLPQLSEAISHYLNSTNDYDLRDMQKTIAEHID